MENIVLIQSTLRSPRVRHDRGSIDGELCYAVSQRALRVHADQDQPRHNAEWSLWVKHILLALFALLIEGSHFQQVGVSMGIWRNLSALSLSAIQDLRARPSSSVRGQPSGLRRAELSMVVSAFGSAMLDITARTTGLPAIRSHVVREQRGGAGLPAFRSGL